MFEIAQRVYADTSVFGGAFDEDFSDASRLFLKQVKSGRFHLILSPIIEKEMLVAPVKVRELYQTISEYGEMLPLSKEALRLQDAYLNAGIVTQKWAADVLHVAHATVHNCRMIVSWNFRHIVHYDKIALYNAINIQEGYSPIGIHSPQEVIDYEENV
ncbi:MAG: hypothetical protein NT106_00765 [Candidatus Sumerlaeota bacterium]|nr:hypothetical protein [Candidatus Sumerlaeota bacterium]